MKSNNDNKTANLNPNLTSRGIEAYLNDLPEAYNEGLVELHALLNSAFYPKSPQPSGEAKAPDKPQEGADKPQNESEG
jgi:hypothetical protein